MDNHNFIDKHMVDDLMLFTDNEASLYNQKCSIEQNIQKKFNKNIYNHSVDVFS